MRRTSLLARCGKASWLAALILLLPSCDGSSPLVPGAGRDTVVEPAGTAVRFRLSEAPGPEPGLVSYTLRLETATASVGAYQGRLTFAPGALEVVSVTTPSPTGGEYQLANTAFAAAGELRFAGYSTEGFGAHQVLSFTARQRSPRRPTRLTVRLDVLANPTAIPLLPQPGAVGARRETPRFSLAATLLTPDHIGFDAGTQAQVRVEPGSTLAVPLIVDLAAAGALNLASLQSNISWATSRLAFASLQSGVPAGWTFTPSTGGAASGTVGFSTGGTTPLAGTTTVATVNFTATANTGGTMLWLNPGAAANAQGGSVLSSVRPRALAVCVAPSGRWGDGTGDGVVNIVDAQQLARYSVGLNVANPAAVTSRGDVTADGLVNIVDAQQVARFSVGLSAAPRTGTALYTFPPTSGISTVSPPASLQVGTSYQIEARTFVPESTGCTGLECETTGCSTVSWSSSNTAVAVVNAAGLVTALAPGTAIITVSSDGVNVPLEVTVQ